MAGERILVVDDEPNIVDLARMYLEKEGYRTCTATTGLGGAPKVYPSAVNPACRRS